MLVSDVTGIFKHGRDSLGVRDLVRDLISDIVAGEDGPSVLADYAHDHDLFTLNGFLEVAALMNFLDDE